MKGPVVIIAVVVAIALVIIYLKKGIVPESSWFHKDARAYLPVAIDKFGAPTVFSPERGGRAVWYKDQLIGTVFKRVELRDESVYDPQYGTFNFVYCTVPYEIIPSKLKETLLVSKNVLYNQERKELTARSDSWGLNTILLQMATSVGNGKYNLKYLTDNKLIERSIAQSNNPVLIGQSYQRLVFDVKFQPGNPQVE